MAEDDDQDATVYTVVVNDEEQFSIWPVARPAPSGWRQVGKTGMRSECLTYIEQVWTDITPLSVRQRRV